MHELDEIVKRNKAFHKNLSCHVNNCCFYKKIKKRRTIKISSSQVCKKFVSEYFTLKSQLDQIHLENKKVVIDKYCGDNENVHLMNECLKDFIGNRLLGLYVHGSIATGEEIPYSDFDGLVIFSEYAFSSEAVFKSVVSKLRKSLKIMYRQDPLQHHGWFVLSENDLKCYCEAYFPSDLFSYAKAIGNSSRTLSLNIRKSNEENFTAFYNLAGSVISLSRRREIKRVYEFKAFMSQVMLLPTLYLQARHGKGFWKGDSFVIARKDFDEETWEVMDKLTNIRRRWKFELTSCRKRIYTSCSSFGCIAREKFSPLISPDILPLVNNGLLEKTEKLTMKMQESLRRKV